MTAKPVAMLVLLLSTIVQAADMNVRDFGATRSACEFLDANKNKSHIDLAPGVESAIVVGNRFRAPARIKNESKGDVQVGLNTGGVAR
jgi:hypothetical protein